jgi:uncharacterized protein (DUF58 family)
MSVVDQLSQRGKTAWAQLTLRVVAAREIAEPVFVRARPVADVVTRLGWGVAVFGFGCWIVGWRFGWSELFVIATAAWLLLALCVLLTIGRARLDVTLIADPQRVTVGDPAAGSVTVTNTATRPLLPIGLELPIGPGAARFALPFMGAGVKHEELFIVPTQRRGVVTVGPASTVRGDPFGLLRKAVSWTHSIEIFVHPVTVPLESLGAGLLRDLEGQTTNNLSMSDLAFHALREFQPGDDRRYIHWRSSAKAGKFLVRQFLDTRRSHVCVVVDSHVDSYLDADEFEVAVSVAASMTIRAVRDEQEISILAGEHAAPSATGSRVLDIYSRAELADHGLGDLARRANRIAPDASLVLLVTGSRTTYADLRRAANEFPVEVRVIALKVEPEKPTGLRHNQGLTVLSLQSLAELGNLMRGVLQ